MKNIYYFNIVYSCNSKCVFCYSHNTRHDSTTNRSIIFEDFRLYLDSHQISSNDRVIINGGEPLLHPQIIDILYVLSNIGCEVLVYTNGRLLENYNFSFITDKFRFIIPIHGDQQTHDKITRVSNSYIQTINGLDYLSKFDAMIDVKIIINSLMLSGDNVIDNMTREILGLKDLNSIHLTTMAETLVSKTNRVAPVSLKDSAILTGKIFNILRKSVRSIKFFDTCILKIQINNYSDLIDYPKVFFKDNVQEWEYGIEKFKGCSQRCALAYCCHSAVKDYTVLEYSDNRFFSNLE
ncbi:MAG: radical SAM protein [Treponema sp.]|nr:radical SAM protein [Treponema sp.]